MNRKKLQRIRLMIPFFLVAFLVCGSGGLFCSMEESAAGTHHSQSSSQQSPMPFNSSADCQDQLKSSEEKSRDLVDGVLPISVFTKSTNIFESTFSHYYLSTSSSPRSSTYPLLFLLFSVFLNQVPHKLIGCRAQKRELSLRPVFPFIQLSTHS